jgi:hypothetical protein
MEIEMAHHEQRRDWCATNRLKSSAMYRVVFGTFLQECYGLVDSWMDTLAILVANIYVDQIVGIQLRAADG